MRHVCVYDNAPSHRKKAQDGLNVRRMRKGIDFAVASAPEMRDTEFSKADGSIHKQTLVFDRGEHKGKVKGLQQVG